MSPTIRPKLPLWIPDAYTPSVQAYVDAFRGELWFDPSETSGYPYNGPAKEYFKRIVKVNAFEAAERFEGKGVGCWGARKNPALSVFTADLLATADALGGRLDDTQKYGSVWTALLDGGVGVFVYLYQHETTNHIRARQVTTVRGPRAYRALLELLGFDWIPRRLFGEASAPSRVEIVTLVDELTRLTPPATL